MRKLKLFLSMLTLFLFSVGTVWATDYQLVTSTDDLVAGANYIIGSADATSAYFMSRKANTNNRVQTPELLTITDGKVTLIDTVLVLELGGSTGKWTFTTVNYAGTNGYLSNAASGTTNACYVQTGKTEFTISFSGNKVVITSTGGNSRNVLRWNSGSKCFACYASGSQKDIYLYKEVGNPAVLFTQSGSEIDTLDYGTVKQHSGTSEILTAELTLEQSGFTAAENVKIAVNGSLFSVYPGVITPSDWTDGKKTISVYASTGDAGSFIGKTTGEDKNYFLVASSDAETPEFANDTLPLKIIITPTFAVSVAKHALDKGAAEIADLSDFTATVNGVESYYAEDGEILNLVAAPKAGFDFVNWTSNNGEHIEFTDANVAETTATVDADVTITANFQEKLCSVLGTPVVTVAAKEYNNTQLTWETVANAESYIVEIWKSGSKIEEGNVTDASYTVAAELLGAAEYSYKVQATSSNAEYCASAVASAAFTTDAYPAATLTFSENGVERALAGDHKLYDVVNLPTTVENAVEEMSLAGWSTVAVATTDTKPSGETFYEPGAEFILGAGANVLYAVYVAGHAASESWDLATSVAAGDVIVFATDTENSTRKTNGGLGSNTYMSSTNSSFDEGNLHITSLADGTFPFTIGGNATDGWTLANGGEYLYISGDKQISLKTEATTWELSFEGNVAKFTQQYNSSTYTMQYNTQNARFNVYSSVQQPVSIYKHNVQEATWHGYTTSPCVKHSITISDAIDFGDVTADLAKACAETVVTLTATPDAHCRFVEWSVNGGAVTVTDNKFAMPDADVTISATFEQIKNAITITEPVGGTLSVLSGEDPVASGAQIVEGAVLTVSATPSTGYLGGTIKVIKTGADPEEDVTDAVLSEGNLTMPNYAVTVSATFDAVPSVTVDPKNLAFGNAEQGDEVAAQTFTITGANLTGTDPLTVVSTSAAFAVACTSGSLTPAEGVVNATITVTPNTENAGEFSGNIKVNGGGLGEDTALVAVSMNVAAKNVVSIAELTNGTITVLHGENPVASGNKIVAGETLNVSYAPNTANAYRGTLKYKVGEGEWLNVENGTITMPAEALSITAEEVALYAISVAKNDEEWGTVTIDGGAGPVYKAEGETVAIVATPAAGYEFHEWMYDDIALTDDKSANTTATVGTAAATITALFKVSSTPEFNVAPNAIDFGEILYKEELAAQTVTIEGANLEGDKVTVALVGNGETDEEKAANAAAFLIDENELDITDGAINQTITVTPRRNVCGTFGAKLVISTTGISDKEVTLSLTVNKLAANLSWSAEEANAIIGEDNEFPTLVNPRGVENIVYSSLDGEVATIDANTGVIELVAPGETYIIANFAGNDTVAAITEDALYYTLTVQKKYTAKWYVNGVELTEAKEVALAGAALTVPADPTATGDCEGLVFRGWVTTQLDAPQADAPEFVETEGLVMPSADVNYYAVFAIQETTGSLVEKSISMTMAQYVEANKCSVGGSNPTCYTSLSLDDNITLSTTGSKNCGAFYSSGTDNQWRLYQKQNGNAIVTASNGYTLKSVTVTYDSYNTAILVNGDEQTVESGVAQDASGSSVTYTVGNSESEVTNGQARVTAIAVEYEKDTRATVVSAYVTTCPHCETLNLVAAEVDHGAIVLKQNGVPVTSVKTCDEVILDVVATPADGYELTGVALSEENDAAYIDGKIYIHEGLTGTLTATATFSAINYTVTMEQTGGAEAEISANQENKHIGDNITVTAEDKDGFVFLGWAAVPAVEFANAKALETTFPMPNSNVTVTAKYAKIYTVAEAIVKINEDHTATTANVAVDGYISSVGSYNSTYHSITYYIKGLDANGLLTGDAIKIYSGKGLNGADFGAKGDIVTGAKVRILGDLLWYASSSEYEINLNNYQLAYEAPVFDTVAVYGAATHTAYEAGDAFDFAGLKAKNVYTNGFAEAIDAENITWAADPAQVNAAGTINVTATVNDHTSDVFPVDVTIIKHAVTFTAEHAFGQLAIMNGEEAIQSGAEFAKGTVLTVVANPLLGYDLTELRVGETDILDAMQFTVGTADIEVVATFSEIVESTTEWREIVFTEIASKGELKDAEFYAPHSMFKLMVTDNVEGGKITIDANNARFGTDLETSTQYTKRLKTGGKSSAANALTLDIPVDGKVRFAVRSASGTEARLLVIKQGETELYNEDVKDEDAIEFPDGDNVIKVYPYVTVNVKAGTVNIEYPTNGLNFYAFAYKARPKHEVSVAEVEHGTLVVMDGEETIVSPAMVAEETNLTIVATPESNEYALTALTVTGATLDGSSFTVGENDVQVAATFAEKDAAPISWSNGGAAVNVTLGDIYELPTLTNNEALEVSYSVTGTEGAVEVSTEGVVTINAIGEVTISAQYNSYEDSPYKTTTVSYNLNIVAPQPYYMKNSWNEASWTWKPMDYVAGIYVLQDVVFGGTGVNYNTSDSDDGSQWRPVSGENHIIAEVEIAAKDTVTFVLLPNTGEVHATNVRKYVAPAPIKFYITGNPELVGGEAGWQANDIAVTEDSYTFHNLPAGGPYFMKVTTDGVWNNPDDPNHIQGFSGLTAYTAGLYKSTPDNISFRLAEAGDVTVTFVKDGDDITTFTVAGNFVAPEVKLIGGISGGWDAEDTKHVISLTNAADNMSASVTVHLDKPEEYGYAFKVIMDGLWLSVNGGYSFDREHTAVVVDYDDSASPALWLGMDLPGDYTFTWSFATNTLTVGYPEFPDFYITGSIAGGWAPNQLPVYGNSKTFNLAAGSYKLKVTTDGTWNTANGYDQLTSALGTNLYTDPDGNVCFRLADAGEVTVAFEAGEYEPETFTVTGNFAAPEIKLIGIKGWDAEKAIVLTNEVDLAYADLTLEAGDYEFKVIVDGEWYGSNYDAGDYRVVDRANRDVLSWQFSPTQYDPEYKVPNAIKLTVDKDGKYRFTYRYFCMLHVDYPEPIYYVYITSGEESAWESHAMTPEMGVMTAAVTLDGKKTYEYKIRTDIGTYFGAQSEGYSMVYGNSTDWDLDSPGHNIGLQTTTNASYTFTFDPVYWKMSVDIPEDATAIDGIDADEKAVKVIHNDMIYIIKGGKTYNITGQIVK